MKTPRECVPLICVHTCLCPERLIFSVLLGNDNHALYLSILGVFQANGIDLDSKFLVSIGIITHG